MSQWMILLYVILAAILVWFGIRMIRNNPQLFSKENISKSFFSIGILTLLLIGFLALVVVLLKHG